MKSMLTIEQKNILLCLGSFGVILTLALADDYLRRDGIPKNQEMTLIKKGVGTRQVKPYSTREKRYSPAKEYRMLCFDTDGNTNTTEVAAIPEGEFTVGIDETEGFKIGEKKTLESWGITLEKTCRQAKKNTSWGEKRERIPILWQFEKQ